MRKKNAVLNTDSGATQPQKSAKSVRPKATVTVETSWELLYRFY